jgi:cold shock CspA family protein
MSATDNSTAVTATTTTAADVSAAAVPASSAEYLGRVKRFNKGSGYGFIEILSEGDRHGQDVFVHHSNIKTQPAGIFRYLNVGESITFSLGPTNNAEHSFQATNVRCSGDGKLNCENSAESAAIRVSRNRNRPQGGQSRSSGAQSGEDGFTSVQGGRGRGQSQGQSQRGGRGRGAANHA